MNLKTKPSNWSRINFSLTELDAESCLNFDKTIRQSILQHEKESLTDVWPSTLNL